MKLAAAALIAGLLAAPVSWANEVEQALMEAEASMLEMRCNAEAHLARTIMTARQRGLPITQITDGMESPRHREMAAEAYDMPRLHTASAQAAAIWEFGDRADIACYRDAQ